MILIQQNEWTGKAQEVEMTDALILSISQHNEYMNPEEVRSALLAGKKVCTEMSCYQIPGRGLKTGKG